MGRNSLGANTQLSLECPQGAFEAVGRRGGSVVAGEGEESPWSKSVLIKGTTRSRYTISVRFLVWRLTLSGLNATRFYTVFLFFAESAMRFNPVRVNSGFNNLTHSLEVDTLRSRYAEK